MERSFEVEINGKPLTIETGAVARQADGAVLVRYCDTVVLVTAVSSKEPRQGSDFLPLTVNYQEPNYAAGKIPGGYFKREGRPTEKETLTSRLIDRPLRPLFPDSYFCETQIIASVLSADKENDPDVLALIGASAALEISDILFDGPIAGVRVGRVDGEFVCNPTAGQLEESDLDIIVAGTEDHIIMVEGGAKIVPEDGVLDALSFAHRSMQPIIQLQKEMRKEVGREKRTHAPVEKDEKLVGQVRKISEQKIRDALKISSKLERYESLGEISTETVDECAKLYDDDTDRSKEVKEMVGDLKKGILREYVVNESKRIDDRGPKDIRPIECKVDVLPRTHGSAIFTRGETQALVVATLGTSSDEQRIDSIMGDVFKPFMLHYNFPPYCVGEARMLRGPGRREVGHGALAERALRNILPNKEDFPYTIRIVSDILESNGSSSMASVCGGSLSLMDAGVPIKAPVAGIAMGLIKEGDKVSVLTDILGDEDHLGDMDFKVAGTKEGITAIQMDIKIGGVTGEILKEALYQAKEARLSILDNMLTTIDTPRSELSEYAPRIVTIQVKTEKIKDVIGPGGKNIKGIVSETGVKIDIDDTGKVNIASADKEAIDKAISMVQSLTQEAEVGKVYKGTVKRIVDFGAFVEIIPGKDGLVHISQLSEERVKSVTDVLSEGDEVVVKVLDIDNMGRVRLSMKEAKGLTPS